MKRIIILLLLALPLLSVAQEEKKKKKFSIKKPNIKIKKPNLRIGEKIGNLAGNMMTGKTEFLAETAPIASMISGIYDPATKTSEAKYFPKGTREGDYLAGITFMKNEGIGMFKIKGDVTCDGQPMEYVGLGSYMIRFDEPVQKKHVIKVTTETGDQAVFNLNPVPEIEILSINDDSTIPIVDLTEDMKIKFTNPEGANNKAPIKVGLITDIAGARAINWFADFTITKDEVTIPHQAFSNLEINGAMGAGNVNKGGTYLIMQRELVTEKSDMDASQSVDALPSATLQEVSYASKRVVVKGKQENGVIATLRFSGGHKKILGYDVHKPNARTGIPFSRASKFGLLSMTINGRTYKKESESGSSSHTVGNTRYTTTWTNTTTYEFPQLPDSYWDGVMEDFYQKMITYFSGQMSIDFAPVEHITSAPGYNALFDDVEVNEKAKISRSYKDTKRATPHSIREIFSNRSSSKSTENPSSYMMKVANVDGLVTVEITFDIGANKEGNIVLLPTVNFSITGMDETKNNRAGTYANGYISYREGVPFDGEKAKSNPQYLSTILNVDNIISCMGYMLDNLRAKEVEMGYDAIWSIGE